MSAEEHSSFIQTPQQLVVVVLLAFLVPVFGILMIVHLVVDRPRADPAAMTPEAIAARIQPLGRVEFVDAGRAAAGARSGEEVVKAVCAACHATGVAGAPKIGDKAAWAPLIRRGLDKMLAVAITGEKAMPPRGGAPDLTDLELARAIVFMANQSGGNLKEPAEAAAKPAAKK
ncbi:MAG: c-type cytochrome [Burkholderiales bacterium]|nr:c-type cytochrome [Burkholderiales bacterium]